ncbi:MAG: sigma 54-interacting transcriptional regulator [Thermodesulfobacteriota bacterium]|nr:sigma 54-interacting transcriptional regulator [Thermodesulfobacteriota bacterium]
MSRILVIDDEESIRFTSRSFLGEEGHEVMTARDYDSALEILSNGHVDLVFADIILGGRTGIDVLREIRNRGLGCPVIMITGEPNVETAAESVRLGAFDYISKPVRKETLLRASNIALHHKALIDEKDRIEAENEKYRYNLEAIFKSVQDAIITVDTDMRVIEANEATGTICGVASRDLVGLRLGDARSHCQRSCYDALEETLQTKRPVKQVSIECKHQQRPRQVVALTCSPLLNRNNDFMGAVLVIRDMTRLASLERELRERHKFQNIIGKSKEMQQVYGLLEDLADSETTVLITGESGTGKELVAEALHYGGVRSTKPLVKVNCSALAENLLESELFGHVKGAFTGAVRDKIGRFQLANGGTLLLDEIGDLSPRIQLKLLRVLQEKTFERVGASASVKVDVRVIAATNQDLKEKVRLGEFRQDLYYRLKVIEVTLPPLRERREDIPLLVDHFCGLFNKRDNKKIVGISDDVRRVLLRYPWPGNVRELEHAIEHAFILCRGSTIRADHLPSETRDYAKDKSPTGSKKPSRGPKEIVKALEKTDWNKAKAARLLGISRQTMYRKIQQYRIARKDDPPMV